MSVATDFLQEISIPSQQLSVIDDDVTIDSNLESVQGNNKLQRCIVTCFPPDTDSKWLLPNTYFTDISIIENWCGQFELSKDGVVHFHIYVSFQHSKKPRFNTIRRCFSDVIGKGCDIKKNKHRASNKGEACSVNYVLAPDKRAPDTEPYIWEHNKKQLSFDESLWKERTTKTSSRSKEDRDKEIIDYIESKPRHWEWNRIVHETYESKLLLGSCSWGSKFHAGRHSEAPRRTIEHVIILYGAGGTGKSTLARKWDIRENEDLEERYYLRNYEDGHFWGSGKTAYKSQRIIHLEEFCGSESASKFKQICDVGTNGPPVNVKNSSAELNHEIVLITSNTHPVGWYHEYCSKDPKQWGPLSRRFTQVLFFPELKPDGSRNTPDSIPYYVDQTEDFQSFVHDFEEACNHASTHWPIRESDVYDASNNMVHSTSFNPSKRQRIN